MDWKTEDSTNEYILSLVDPDGWYSVRVKWDGCVDFRQYFTVPLGSPDRSPDDNEDYMHICDVDDLIDLLQSIKAKGNLHFGDNGYWGGGDKQDAKAGSS